GGRLTGWLEPSNGDALLLLLLLVPVSPQACAGGPRHVERVRVPKRPCVSPSGPAEKNRVVDGPAAPSLPTPNPHRPSIVIGLPLGSLSWPANWKPGD